MPNEKPEDNEKPAIDGVSIQMRIPSFWRHKPRLWFTFFEAATSDLKKGPKQMAQMVIRQLEVQDIEEIADLLKNLDNETGYESIKNRLISVYEDSETKNLEKLLSEIDLGDQKPSQLLRRMKTQAQGVHGEKKAT